MKQNLKTTKNEIDKPEIMINILCQYLKSLNYDYIKFISNTIMNNFILYKQKMISKKLNNVFIIYTKQELLSIQQNLLKWQQNTLYNLSKNHSKIDFENNSRDNYFHLNLNVGPIMNNSRGIPIIINNNNNNNSNSHINNSYINNENENNIRNYNVNNNINRNNKNTLYRNNYSTINNSLSNISSTQKAKQRPYSSEAPKRNKSYMLMDNRDQNSILYQKMKKNKNISNKIVNKFIQRQEKYIKNNSQKKQKIINENEEEYKLIYTFEPKVNDSLRKLYKKDKLSASKRLYNDSIIRKNKILEKQINNDSKINSRKSFNQTKYIELYEDSKIRKEKKEELIKKIERECGYTYAPTLRNNNNINFIPEYNNKNINKKKNENKSCIKINKDKKIKNIKRLEKNNSCQNIVNLKKKKIQTGNKNNNH